MRHVRVAELHGERRERASTCRHRPRVRSSALASSRPGGSVSRSATASSLACCDSAVRPGHQRISRQPAERLALLQPLPERAPQLQLLLRRPRSPRRCRRSGSTRASAARAGRRARAGGRSVAEPQGARVLGGRLAVGADGRGARGRGGRIAEHRLRVAGRLGVVREPREVRAPPGGSASAASAARCSSSFRCGATESSTARRASSWRKAMPAVFGPEHPGGEALVEPVRATPRRAPRAARAPPAAGRPRPLRAALAPRGRDAPPGRAPRPGPSRGSRRRRRRAPRRRRTGCRRSWRRARRRRRRTARPARRPRPATGRQLHPADRRTRGELAEHDPQRIGDVELVVAVAGDDERGHRLDPAGEQAEDVERRLVGPVHVLEHEDGRAPSAAAPRASAADDLVRHRAPLDER